MKPTAVNPWLLCVTSVLLLTTALPAYAAEPTSAAAQEEVRQATLKYYVALNSAMKGELEPISGVWLHASNVTDLGRLGGSAVGWNEVYAHYQSMARMNAGANFAPTEIKVVVDGDMAYTVCNESGQARSPQGGNVSISGRATNIFRRDNGKWKLIHHHADPTGALQETERR